MKQFSQARNSLVISCVLPEVSWKFHENPFIRFSHNISDKHRSIKQKTIDPGSTLGRRGELKWRGGWSTVTVGWLSAGSVLGRVAVMNIKCLVPLPFLPELELWFTENRYHD